jgi:hypothetical protein
MVFLLSRCRLRQRSGSDLFILDFLALSIEFADRPLEVRIVNDKEMPALRVATAGRADRCIEDAASRIERNRVGTHPPHRPCCV